MCVCVFVCVHWSDDPIRKKLIVSRHEIIRPIREHTHTHTHTYQSSPNELSTR